jgi:glycosyltransferase involved in cell wall biosynthesis
MINLSAIILTYNGEKYLDKAIKQLQKIADEVIIVDSGSTDKTIEIAESNNCIIKYNKFENYGIQWIYAEQFTKNDWVIMNDQDEILSDELIEEITEHQKNGFEYDVYIIKRINHFLGKEIRYSGWGDEGETKLYNKTTTEIEPINHAYVKTDKVVGTFKHYCYHYPYDTVEQYISKINNYAKIAANEAMQKGRKFRLINLIFNPFFRFFKKYILQLGILDGFHGFLLAVLSYYAVFLKYLYLWELSKKD